MRLDGAPFSPSAPPGTRPAASRNDDAVPTYRRGRGNVFVSDFNDRWRVELGTYLRALPGGDQKGNTVSRIDLIFRSKLVTNVAGRIFLYGEPLSLSTVLKSI